MSIVQYIHNAFYLLESRFIGGSDCEYHGKKGPVCLVSQHSNCADKKRHIPSNNIDHIYFSSQIFYSYVACLDGNRQQIGKFQILKSIG